MRRTLSLLVVFLVTLFGFSQGVEYRIVESIRNGNMMMLRKAYVEGGDSVQTPFLKPFSEYLIAHSGYQSRQAVEMGDFLLEKYHSELIETEMLPYVVRMLSEDFTLLGDYRSAATLLDDYNEYYRQSGAVLFEHSEEVARLYDVLADVGGFQVEKPREKVVIPLKYDSLSTISVEVRAGRQHFDAFLSTGVDVNYMSKDMAESLNARILTGEDADEALVFAIVDSLWMGEILYRNIPFCIVERLDEDNDLDGNVVVGQCLLSNSVLLGLEEVLFDWGNRQMVVPERYSLKPGNALQLWRSVDGPLQSSFYDIDHHEEIVATIDTGIDTGIITSQYLNRHRHLCEQQKTGDVLCPDSVGGEELLPYCPVPIRVRVGANVLELNQMRMERGVGQFLGYGDLVLGLPALFQLGSLTLNFKDMWLMLQ